MANAAAPNMIPPGGAPAPAVTPQLPYGTDPGTITGWILENTTTKTSESITQGPERGFNRLVDNIPLATDPGYEAIMRGMTNEVINSDTMVTYLVATNICNDVVRVTVVHSIARYSAGFGGSNALHRRTLALLGEKVGTQLPLLVCFTADPDEDLAHGFVMEDVTVPSDGQVETYFGATTALNVISQTTVANGGAQMNLPNLCLIPLA
jgi:hypothetical protein